MKLDRRPSGSLLEPMYGRSNSCQPQTLPRHFQWFEFDPNPSQARVIGRRFYDSECDIVAFSRYISGTAPDFITGQELIELERQNRSSGGLIEGNSAFIVPVYEYLDSHVGVSRDFILQMQPVEQLFDRIRRIYVAEVTRDCL